MLPRRLLTLIAALLALAPAAPLARAQVKGIANGIPYTSDAADTVASPYLPTLPTEVAGAHGFLKNNGEGNFVFDDGTPARFFGVSMQWAACFPDSAEAILTAARFRKLGVNLVRFVYMDNAFDWGDYGQIRTFLDAATGFRTIHAEQMRRFDWFVYQLKMRGIYSYLTLQSARSARASDGLGAEADSTVWLGHELPYLYPEARATSKLVSQLLLDHVNPFTHTAYKAEPAIAMMEAMDQGSLITMFRLNQTEYRADQSGFSFRHSRRLDTLYSDFLKTKYSSTAALGAAWKTTPPPGGFPNLITEGSFEGDFERYWTIDGYDGISVSKILTQSDSVPDGSLALKLRIRNASGDSTKGNSYMIQAIPLEYNTLYHLTFKVKTTTPGRSITVYASQSSEAGLYAGLSSTFTLTNYWKQQEAYFLVPIKSSVPINIVFYFGGAEGDILFDDIQLKRYEAPGLQPAETLENATVVRIPNGNDAALAVSSQRMEDQGEFYLSLERNYFSDMHRFLHDTVGVKQPFTGAGHYWASSYMETAVEGSSDFTFSSKGWDYVSGGATDWQVRNTSPLRDIYDAGAIYQFATGAHRHQPFIASYSQPFPNLYQGEGMLMTPAYSLLQDWDGFIWDFYTDNPLTPDKFMDSLSYYQIAKNPLITTLMPAVSALFRGGLLSPATTTIAIQHSEQQARLFPRHESAWGGFAVPGGVPGRSMATDRVVADSLNASYYTQYDDISFAPQVDGQSLSDTRQILWEYNRGSVSLDAPRVQAASGFLTRAGGITLRNLDVNLLSGNETATILWVPLDTVQRLSHVGRSLLVIDSRFEPTGWHWQDSMHADLWGHGPMVFDPVRVRLAFKPDDSANVLMITPLDSSGLPSGPGIKTLRSGNKFETTIDQGTTHSVWFAVELMYDASASVREAEPAALLTAEPSIVTDRSYITYVLPAAARDARLELFDALGRVVGVLHAGAAEAGSNSVRLEAGNLPSGAYIVRLQTDAGLVAIAKITVAH